MEKAKFIGIGAIVIILAAGAYFISPEKYRGTPPPLKSPLDEIISKLKNSTFEVEGAPVTLVNGISEIEAAPGSAAKIVTRYFGNEVKHDLNDDGREDAAFILTQETGGSGTFFYFVAALNTPAGYIGSQAFFLGNRIAPQTTNMDEGKTVMGSNRQNVIAVNYAVRLPNEPFTNQPSLGKSV